MAGKVIKTIIVAGVSLGVLGLLFTIFCNVQLKTDRKTYSVNQTEKIDTADYVIVPGCLVYKSGKPSYALEDRLNGALKLYQEKKVPKIILSGEARENQAGKIFLTDRGVSEEDILIDDGGLDTYSTIYRCTEAFPEKKFIVCTQQKYFKRSGDLISKLGMMYTPIFAVARIVGWSAHRMEELVNVDKIIRPAYQSIMQTREYVPLEER